MLQLSLKQYSEILKFLWLPQSQSKWVSVTCGNIQIQTQLSILFKPNVQLRSLCWMNFIFPIVLYHVCNWKTNSSDCCKKYWSNIVRKHWSFLTNIHVFGKAYIKRESNNQLLNASLEYILSKLRSKNHFFNASVTLWH